MSAFSAVFCLFLLSASPDAAALPDTSASAAGAAAQTADSSLSSGRVDSSSSPGRVDTLAPPDSLAAYPIHPPDSLAEPDSSALEDTVKSVPRPQPESPARDSSALKTAKKITFGPRALRYNGIYLGAGSLADSARIGQLIERTKGTPVGGFVMDMKDDRGYLSYPSKLPLALQIGSGTRRVKNPAALVRRLHDNGLIACARVVSFKDPILSRYTENGAYPYAVLDSVTGLPWKQANGETWANPQDDRVHDYLVGVVRELIAFGFDQVQLDYLRFPSDGETAGCYYPVTIDSLNKAEVIALLLSKVRRATDSAGVSLAADVFGWVPWLHKDRNYWIGQDYDLIAEHTDVVCPMLYSSHFPESFKAEYGAQRAYHIVREGTRKAVERRGKLKTGVQPYIQCFKWRAPHFGSDYLLQQMKAAEEGGAVGWIVWNARNDYSALWRALQAGSANLKSGSQ